MRHDDGERMVAAHGVVLIAPGLNTAPDVMDGFVEVLGLNGLHCLRLSLQAEGVSARSSPGRIEHVWLRCFREGYDEAVLRFPELPRYCLAFSLGAACALRFLDDNDDASFDSMMLLAPPVALTRTAGLVRFLVPLWRLGAVLPSAAPRGVRARWATPLSEYGALMNMVDGLQVIRRSDELRQMPTRIVVDADDELVSYSGIRSWVGRNGLERWRVDTIPSRSRQRRGYRHFIVTEAALGPAAWHSTVAAAVSLFAGRGAPGEHPDRRDERP